MARNVPGPWFVMRGYMAHADWRELYQLLGLRVFRMMHRMTGDPAVAEDLTHDAFVRVHEARHQYDGSGPVAAWVFRIAANIGRDHLRQRTMQADRLLAFQARTDQAPVLDHELRLSLEAALLALEPTYRTVVLLHDVDGFTHAEIADLLDIREGTSRARLSRARELLRGVLTGGTERMER